MQKDLISLNKLTAENTNTSLSNNPEDLLKSYLSTTNSDSSIEGHNPECNCPYCRQIALRLDSLESSLGVNNLYETISDTDGKPNEPQNIQQTNPQDDLEMVKKINSLKSARDEFDSSQNPNFNLLNQYLPYRASITNNAEKLKAYDALVTKILHKAKFEMTDEEFGKSTKMSDLTKLKPMDSFLSYIIAGSIADLYHNREDLIDKVLDRPGGFTLVALQRKKDSGAVGMYDTTSNTIFVDGSAVVMGALNLKGPDNKIEQLDVAAHEFTHAIDTADSQNNTKDTVTPNLNRTNNDPVPLNGPIENTSEYSADGVLPGMTDKDKQILEVALNETKTNGDGIDEYAKTSPQEFIATTFETFMDDPLKLKNGPPALKALYEMYTNYLRFDPVKEEKITA